MNLDELREELKCDLGFDVNSLGISNDTIDLKIKEALRKISSYAPYVKIDSYTISNNRVVMPENTCGVISVLTTGVKPGRIRNSSLYDEADLFHASRYIYNPNSMSDPYIYMMNMTEIDTLQKMISLDDWMYNKGENCVYFNNPASQNVTIKSLENYTELEQIKDYDMLQYIKEYSLALCKIVEGNIRRKLQGAPGSIQMDGDSLVSEGISEKATLDEKLPALFSYLRFGIRV